MVLQHGKVLAEKQFAPATAHVQNMQQELNLIWDHILPALQ